MAESCVSAFLNGWMKRRRACVKMWQGRRIDGMEAVFRAEGGSEVCRSYGGVFFVKKSSGSQVVGNLATHPSLPFWRAIYSWCRRRGRARGFAPSSGLSLGFETAFLDKGPFCKACHLQNFPISSGSDGKCHYAASVAGVFLAIAAVDACQMLGGLGCKLYYSCLLVFSSRICCRAPDLDRSQ